MQDSIFKTMCGRVCSAAVLAAFASAAWAAPEGAAEVRPGVNPPAVQQDAAPAAVAPDTTAAAPARQNAMSDFGPVADLGKLEQSRGGTDVHNESNLSGMVTNNSATNVVTGNNVIDAGSFANMTGIPVVIQNTGANVLIQSSTIINVQFK